MKILKSMLVFALLTAFAGAQNYVTAQGGAISDLNSKALSLPLCPVTFLNIGSGPAPAAGTVTLSTAVFSSGTLAAGATFPAGGTFIVQIPASSITYNGVITGATWTQSVLANGTKTYTLSGTATDIVTGETSSFTLLTANNGKANFAVTLSVQTISIALN